MGVKFANNAYSTLASGITDSDTTITVKTGEGDRFPTADSSTGDYFYVTLVDQSGNREIVKVIDRDPGSDTMTIERAQQGTTARSFAADDIVSHRLEAETLTSIVNGSGIDGDKLDIDWNPSNYTPDASISEVDDEDDLSAHLKGIDDKFSDVDNELNNCVKINESNEFTQDQYVNGNLIWHAGNDGSDSGLDADLLDGKHANGFAYSEVKQSIDLDTITQSGMYKIGEDNANMPSGVDQGQLLVIHGGGDTIVQIVADYNSDYIYWRSGNPSEVGGSGSWGTWQKIWHEGNDGSGSGLDADLLDGQHASAFASSSHNHDSTYVKLSDYEDSDVLAKIKNVDGSGSGLDADLVRGLPADFTCSKNQNGYTKLPNGLIIQWGRVNNDGTGHVSFSFPITFPNALFSIAISDPEEGNTQHTTYVENRTTSGAEIRWRGGDGAYNANTDLFTTWIAIGY